MSFSSFGLPREISLRQLRVASDNGKQTCLECAHQVFDLLPEYRFIGIGRQPNVGVCSEAPLDQLLPCFRFDNAGTLSTRIPIREGISRVFL